MGEKQSGKLKVRNDMNGFAFATLRSFDGRHLFEARHPILKVSFAPVKEREREKGEHGRSEKSKRVDYRGHQ